MNNFISDYEITNDIKTKLRNIENNLAKINAIDKNEKYYKFCDELKQEIIFSTLKINNKNLTIADVKQHLNSNKIYEIDKNIIEVKNIKNAYENASEINIYKIGDLLKIHNIVSRELIQDTGCTRSQQVVSYLNGNKIVCLALPPKQVVLRLETLFEWLRTSEENTIIKACVFYYEFAFIHPFRKYNGVVSRIWQKAILSSYNKCFMKVPIESAINNNFENINSLIAFSKGEEDCTSFVNFMLLLINNSLESFITAFNNRI